MKILIVVPDTEVGGVNIAAVNLSNELVSRGHNVCFLDMPGDNKCIDRLDARVERKYLQGKSALWNIGVESINCAGSLKKLGIIALGVLKKLTIRSGLWYRLIFSKFGKGECFDVAVAFRQCAPCYSFVLNKVNAKKKIAFVHGELTYMGDISSWKKYMTSFDKIAYVSNAVKEQFVSTYPELQANAATIYNMFNVEQIKRMADELPAVELDKAKINIVTVARIDNAFKQTHWIVEICERLKEQTDKPFHWYVVGDGPDYDETVALAHERGVEDVLTFVGNQPNPYAIVKQCDFTVLCSKSESYGMVVVESFILKRPAVVAEYLAIHEIMETGKHGLIAKQSIEDLAVCVKKMIENNDGIREKCKTFLEHNETNNNVAYNQFIEWVK